MGRVLFIIFVILVFVECHKDDPRVQPIKSCVGNPHVSNLLDLWDCVSYEWKKLRTERSI